VLDDREFAVGDAVGAFPSRIRQKVLHFNGFPARLVVPGWTGAYRMKHLVMIEAATKHGSPFIRRAMIVFSSSAFQIGLTP
jgi:hypothetical protein